MSTFGKNLEMGGVGSSPFDQKSADIIAEQYYKAYKDYYDFYIKNCSRARINENISSFEMVALGQQLQQYQQYQKFVESQSNVSSLGPIPRVALDVITAAAAGSVLPLLCSIQPISEEHSIIYYKNIYAQQESGGYGAGDIISSPLQRDNPGLGTLGSQKNQVIITGNGSDTEFAGNVANLPVRIEKFNVMVPEVGIGRDGGDGKIYGFGFSGDIDYKTGVYSIRFKEAPADGTEIKIVYDTDTDTRDEIEAIQAGLVSKPVIAEVIALRSDVGAFANFAFQNRFGRSAVTEVASDLTNEITRVMNTWAVRTIMAYAPESNINWSQTPDPGTDYAMHKLTFDDALAAAEAQLHYQSGASVANRYICGNRAAAVLRGLPGFVAAADMATVSVGLFGYYNDVPVIRATTVVPDNEIYVLSNVGNYFNAPLAYSPFMPLMITNTVQHAANPFRQSTAVGIWSAMTACNMNLVTKLTITNPWSAVTSG